VAPAPIENLLNAHPMVEMSLVSGVGQPAAYAVVVLAEAPAPAPNRELADYEQLRMIVIARDPGPSKTALLTPTMKIKRAASRSGHRPRRWSAGTAGRVQWQ
jgi:long-chain acyl-CoA synthetase